jgi:hypothetical protein
MEKVIEIPWNTEDGCKLEKFPEGNYGISSFQIINDNKLAVLCDIERSVKVYDLETKNLTHFFYHDEMSLCYLLSYSNKTKEFYLFNNNKILSYSKNGSFIKSIDVSKKILDKGIVQLKVQNDNLYAVCGYRTTYTLIENGSSLTPEKQEATKTDGVYDEKGHVIKIDKTGKTDFDIISSENPNKKYPLSFDWDYSTDVKYIGGNDEFFAFVVYYLTPDKKMKSNLVFYSREKNQTINKITIPSIYYTRQYNAIEFHNNTIYQLFTKPTHAVLLKYNYGVTKSPDIDNTFDFDYPKEFLDFDMKDHYDSEDQIYNEPSIIPDESKEQQNEKFFDGNINGSTMGS